MTTISLQQARVLAAHTHIAALGVNIGDKVRLHDYLYFKEKVCVGARSNVPYNGLNAWTEKEAKQTSDAWSDCTYSNRCPTFRGIDANGDAWVQAGRTEFRVPVEFLSIPQETTNGRLAETKLNGNHKAVLHSDLKTVIVGCQRMELTAVRDFIANCDKAIADEAAKKAAKVAAAPTAIAISPTPTYVPAVLAPKAAKPAAKKVAKPATKKVPAKKVPAKKVPAKKVAK